VAFLGFHDWGTNPRASLASTRENLTNQINLSKFAIPLDVPETTLTPVHSLIVGIPGLIIDRPHHKKIISPPLVQFPRLLVLPLGSYQLPREPHSK